MVPLWSRYARQLRTLDDLTGHLKRVCHERHRLGTAKTNLKTVEGWAKAANEGAMLDISNLFWKSTKVSNQERKFALQYRTEGLYTQRLAELTHPIACCAAARMGATTR